MRIIDEFSDKENKLDDCFLGDLVAGETFKILGSDSLYIRGNIFISAKNSEYNQMVKCTNLVFGIIMEFSVDEIVTPVKAEVILK